MSRRLFSVRVGKPGVMIPERTSGEGAATTAVLLASAALFVPLALPLASGRVFTVDDLAIFHLPLRWLYGEALSNGASILWTPFLFNGFYLHAEGQSGALHPLHLALYGAAPLDVAFNVELILTCAAAFTGMWIFLARFRLTPASCAMGATAFAFSGFNLLHLPHLNGVAVAAHIPWLLAAAEVLISGPRRWRHLAFGGMALIVGSQVLLGHPQFMWMSTLSVGVFVLARMPGRSGAGPLVLAAGAGVLGLAIGAAQLLPSLGFLESSVRQSVTPEFALTFSLHPLNLAQLWSPYVFEGRVYAEAGERFVHEFGTYNGALCTLAIVWVLLRWRHAAAHKPVATAGLALCAAGVVLALGRYGFVYELVTGLPLVGKFRAPARYLLLVHLGLSLLLALMYEDLVRAGKAAAAQRATLRPLMVPLVLSAVTAMWAWFAPTGATDAHGALGGMAVFGVATILVRDAAAGRRTALVALPVFLAVDLGLWGFSYVWSRPPLTIREVAAGADLPPAFRAGTVVHTADLDGRRNLLVLHGLKLFEGYVGLGPARHLDPGSPEALRLGGVEWVLREGTWSAVPDPFLRVRVLSEARVTARPSMEVRTIDLARVALTPAPLPELGPAGGSRADVVLDVPGRMDLDVVATGRALLVTTESYHAGWTATAADRRLATTPVYGDFLGVVLEPGEYRLRLRFSPRDVRTGAGLSLAAGLLALGVLSLSFLPRRRGP